MAEINTPIDNNEEFDKFEMLRARFQEWLAYGESALEQEIEPVSELYACSTVVLRADRISAT